MTAADPDNGHIPRAAHRYAAHSKQDRLFRDVNGAVRVVAVFEILALAANPGGAGDVES